MNSPNGNRKPKIWLVIVVVIIILGCCCVSLALAGALFVRSSGMSLGDWFSGLLPSQTQNEIIETLPEEISPPSEPEQAEPADDALEDIGEQGAETVSPPQEREEFLLAITPSGIWKVGTESQEVQQIGGEVLDAPQSYRKGLSPDKKYYAYITGEIVPTLVLLDLQTNDRVFETPLSGPASQIKPNMNATDPGQSVLLAMQFPDSLAWSPDSAHLAFVAAMDDASTNLYLLSATDLTVSRLTDEDSNAAFINWSPDGGLIEFVSVNNFGTGAGMDMDAIWVYDVSQGSVKQLEESTSSGEAFLSWIDNDSFYINSWSRMCSDYNLRIVNALTESQEVIRESCFSGAAYDPVGKMGLLSVSDLFVDACSCGDVDEYGTYIFGESLGMGDVGINIKKFEYLNAYNVKLLDPGTLFAVYTDLGLSHLFDKTGYPISIPSAVAGMEPYPAPGGEYWAWYPYYGEETGLWVTDSQDKLIELSNASTGNVVWQEDGDRVYFIESNQIRYADAPEFHPAVLAELPVDEIYSIGN